MTEATPDMSHDEAVKAITDCAATTTVLSYQEAIEGYLKLRGLAHQPDALSANGIEAAAKVKPLRWYKPTDHPHDSEDALWLAHGIGGRYSIQEDGANFIVWDAADAFSFVTFSTVEQCKAWAEADWQATARRALAEGDGQ